MISAAVLTPPSVALRDCSLPLGECLQDRGGLVGAQVNQDRRHDLRVLVAQQLGHRDGVHPLQALDARDVAALDDAVDQQVGLVVTQRLAQHGLDVLVGVGHQHAHLGRLLREDLEARGPVKLSDVEAEQKEMLKVVRRLADEGQIMLSSGGDDEYV